MISIDEVQYADSGLPESITLRSGGQISVQGDHWKFQDGVRTVYMNFSTLPPQVLPLVGSLKKVLINFLQINSSEYAENMLYYFRRLANVVAKKKQTIDCIEVMHVINYIGEAGTDDTIGLKAQLSSLLKRWFELGIDGVADDVPLFLKSRRKKGNVKGEAVITLDPVKGPLSDIELQDLMGAVNRAYAQREIEEELFLLMWLIAVTGQRVGQYCALKVKDIRKAGDESPNGYEIDLPRSKQRGLDTRDSFITRPLPEEIGKPLWTYAQGVALALPDLGVDAPLFPQRSKSTESMQVSDNYAMHSDGLDMQRYLVKGLNGIAPISVRTGKPIHIAVGRFRDTIGTRAAQEGYGELVIAEILGHSDTQNVKCYVGVIPEIAERLDKQLVKELAPISGAFMGRVLQNKDDATRAGDPRSDIVDYANAGQGVGSCSSNSDCRFLAPIACYTCHNFEAWSDAPHQALLDHLLSERDRLMQSSGQRIAAINDRTIIAIQAVVNICDQMDAVKPRVKSFQHG